MAAKYRCRACCQRIDQKDCVGTGATCISEGCFHFHRQCLDALPKEGKDQANQLVSDYFKESDKRLKVWFVQEIEFDELLGKLSGSDKLDVEQWINRVKGE